MKTSKLSTNLSALGALIAIIPILGWAVSPLLLLVAIILAIVSMSKSEAGGSRALLTSILAGPLALFMGTLGFVFIASL
jgi:uncharacterized membrane protein